MKVGHELALGHVNQAVVAYKRWLVGMGDDTTRVRNLERDLKDPVARGAAITRMVQRNDMHSAVAFTRWLVSEDAVLDLLEHKPSAGRGPTPTLLLYAVVGPHIRSTSRYRALLPKLLGRPEVADSLRER
jgi:hypothetical protein